MVAPVNDITREDVLAVLDYDPITGVFTWKPRPHDKRWTVRYAGKQAGVLESSGYRQIKVRGKLRMAHRLAWLIMTGVWPEEWIDHENLDRDDNSFDNLRQATKSQNHANRRAYRTSKTGLKGASFNARTGKYRAQISHGGKVYWLGAFETPEEAHAVYALAARERHGEFARAA